MTHRRSWRSGFEAVRGFGQQPPAPPAEPAEAAGQAAPGDAVRPWPGASRECPDLLLMRMEALRVDPVLFKASMPTEFRVLAHVCEYCQAKVRCERDLVYEAAGKAVSWEDYCPNAFRLRAKGMRELHGQNAEQPAR